MTPEPEALVVGGGPAGAAAAYWLARLGHAGCAHREGGPTRETRSAATASPRAPSTNWRRWASTSPLPGFHRCRGLRSHAGGITLELDWPEHPVYPNWGAVMRRADLDGQIAALAAAQGATAADRH